MGRAVSTQPGAIYFVKCKNRMKIGRTNGGLGSRVTAVMAACPYPAEYLGAYGVMNAYAAEKLIHDELKKAGHHVHREWFTIPRWLRNSTDHLDRNIQRIENMIYDLHQMDLDRRYKLALARREAEQSITRTEAA